MKGTRHKSNPDFQRAAGWCEAAEGSDSCSNTKWYHGRIFRLCYLKR